METVSFDEVYFYNTLQVGITVSVILFSGDESTDFEAKIDTGSSFCVFERQQAEKLNLDVESGELLKISTATSSFEAYGHELSLMVMGIKTYAKVYFAKEDWFTRNVLGRQGWLDRVKLSLLITR